MRQSGYMPIVPAHPLGVAWGVRRSSGLVVPLASTFIATTLNNSTDLTTYTFAAADIGAPSADRRVLIGFYGGGLSASQTISSVTIGGIAATSVAQLATSNFQRQAFFIAAVPTGATGDIVIVWSGPMTRCHVRVWALTGLQSPTATATATDATQSAGALSKDIDVQAGGAGFALALCNSLGTWTFTAGLAHRTHNNGMGNASDDFATAQTGLTVTASHDSGAPADPGLLVIAMR